MFIGGMYTVTQKYCLGDVSPEFEAKVFTIADEVLKILKELSIEKKTQINSSQIADRMYSKDSLKGLLNDIHAITEDEGLESGCIKELSSMLLNKFSELVPAYMAGKLGDIKDSLHNKTLDGDPKEWIDSPIEVVKAYIDSISTRNNELENFLNQTMEHVSSTEENTSRELSFQKQRLKEDIVFENSISSNIDEIKQDITVSDDLNDIKSTVMKKIEEIYKRIETKRAKDKLCIKETEKTLEEMNVRMSEIKREADEIRRKSKSAEYEARHDALTGVYNRKAYESKLTEILADVSRYGITASLMICDIDFFMNINRKWGHKVGDLALRKLALHIKDRMRTNDFIARYGEDRFAIILPHTECEGARIVGERLRSFVHKAKFSYKGNIIPLSVSAGISCARKDDDMHTLFERAFAALLQAKKSGRNSVKTEEESARI